MIEWAGVYGQGCLQRYLTQQGCKLASLQCCGSRRAAGLNASPVLPPADSLRMLLEGRRLFSRLGELRLFLYSVEIDHFKFLDQKEILMKSLIPYGMVMMYVQALSVVESLYNQTSKLKM